jgi:hypothetical protein
MALLVLVCGGCSATARQTVFEHQIPRQVYTQHNLWFWNDGTIARRASGHQRSTQGTPYEMLRACSPVTLMPKRIYSHLVMFTYQEQRMAYYPRAKGSPEQVMDDYKRVFGYGCPAQNPNLTEADHQGIGSGIVTPGMTREGVIIALGSPTEESVPQARTWWFDISRNESVEVEFEGDVVADVRLVRR